MRPTPPRQTQVPVLGRGGFRSLAYAEWGSTKATRTVICVHGVSRSGLGRGLAADAGKVFAAEFAGCGHAPALMEREQIAVIEDFVFPQSASLVPVAVEQRARTGRTAQTRP